MGMKLTPAFRDFRRSWSQLFLADFMARIIGVVLIAPVVGLLLKVFLMTTETGVLNDDAILFFLMHPVGLAALILVGGTILSIVFA